MSFNRTSRLSEEIKKIISNIIRNELKDPRIPMLTSVTAVEVTNDLRYAKVFISVFGTEDQKQACIEGLKSAAGYIRREVAGQIKARYTPEMIFELDKSIEHSLHISKLLNNIGNKE